MFVLYNGSKRLSYGKIERPYYLVYNKEKSCEHTNCLERIRPHQRLDTSTACVKPNQTDHSHDSEGEWDTILLEDKALQNDAHHIETHGGTRHLRQEEEPCSRFIGIMPQTPLQITIDGSQIQPVIDGKQQKCHQEIADNKA